MCKKDKKKTMTSLENVQTYHFRAHEFKVSFNLLYSEGRIFSHYPKLQGEDIYMEP